MTFEECLQETIIKLGITKNSSYKDKVYCYIIATRGGVVSLPIIEPVKPKKVPRDFIKQEAVFEVKYDKYHSDYLF